MMNLKPFNENQIPPIATSGFNSQNSLSDDYYGLVETTGGDLVKSIVRYDHYRNKWLISRSGCIKVVEYYKQKT